MYAYFLPPEATILDDWGTSWLLGDVDEVGREACRLGLFLVSLSSSI